VIESLDQVAVNRLLVLEARRIGLDKEPRIELGNQAQLDGIKYELGLERWLDELVAAVPEPELRGYFWQNRERYQSLRTLDLSVILLKPPEGEELWDTLKRGERLVEQIRAGADFAELARAHSQHYSAKDGGRIQDINDHAIARKVQSTAKFRRRLSALADGDVSDAFFSECYDPGPLRFVPTGVLIVRRNGATLPRQLDFEAAEDMVRDQYQRRYHTRLVEEAVAAIADEVDLTIDLAALPPL
jgi:hypothetical protein